MTLNAPGQLVTVNDTRMHVYSLLQSSPQTQGTIVFLAGSGTGCPTYDFKPLWYLLKDRFNIAVVERPGYGWSELTMCPRDIDTMLEETREALKQAGIVGPYIPAPHSMSGLEAIYWEQKYPDEVAGIIGLDMAVPQFYNKFKRPPLLSMLVSVGHLFSNPIAKSMVKKHPVVKKGMLNSEEQAAMISIMAKQTLSKNMVDEADYLKDNAFKVGAGKCPNVPLICFLSRDSIKRMPPWGKVHREYFAENSNVKFVELPCGHFVHTQVPEEIAKSITGFFVK